MPRPAELWTALRGIAGESVRLPSSFELVLATVLELPPVAAASFDLSRPIVGALLSREQSNPVAVIAVRVLDGSEVVTRVATGTNAPFESKPNSVQGLTLLLPKAKGGPCSASTAITSSFRPRPERSRRRRPTSCGRSRARPLPAEPLVFEIPGAALKGPLAGGVRRAWEAYQRELRELERRARREGVARRISPIPRR